MRWIVRGALLFILAFANLNDIWSPDVVPNTLLVWSLAREGDLDLDEFTIPEGAPTGPGYAGIPRQTYYFRACGISTFTGTPSAPRSLGGPPPQQLPIHEGDAQPRLGGVHEQHNALACCQGP